MRIACFGVALAVLAALASPPASAQSRVEAIRERLKHANLWRDHVMIVAHRGGGLAEGKTLYPENSLAAIRGAIALGAEMVEVDVRQSKDGVTIVMHDSWLDRTTTCRGIVAERTLAELKACRLVVEGTGRATEETVPTLAEVLLAAKDRILVNIDNKLAPEALPGIAADARNLGVADHIVVKQNLWNAERIAKMRGLLDRIGGDVMFMPIIADDAVRDATFLEAASKAFSADAVELITWRVPDKPKTETGGPLFSAKARAVASRGDWHLWVNTYGIVNKAGGWLAGGRGDELAVAADFPEESFGFWVDRGATMIQTDEPKAAIDWLAANGYRIPYPPVADEAADTASIN
jgi:glycerophosphoryl diester phosphodiesterase